MWWHHTPCYCVGKLPMMRQCLCLCLRNGKNQPAERGIESSANGRNLIRYLAVVLFFVGGVGYRNTGKVPEGGAHCSSEFSLVLSSFLFFLSFFLVAWGFHNMLRDWSLEQSKTWFFSPREGSEYCIYISWNRVPVRGGWRRFRSGIPVCLQ